jgi:hypothetical protein
MGRDASINAHEKVGYRKVLWVWFEGSTALVEGQAVCYNYDYGTAEAADGRRCNRVELPSQSNARYFAGVAARAYSASTGGQFIEINGPGSWCNIHAKADCTLGTGSLTFDITSSYQGFFRYEGLDGEGSADILQTVDRSSVAGKVFAKLQEGPPSGGVEVVPLVDNGAIGTLMIGGTTLVTGSAIATGNCTYTLADGTIAGLRKKFKIITAEITANDLVITVTSGATDDIDDVSLDTVTFAGASTVLNTSVTLTWDGAWMVNGRSEDVPALAGS